MNAKFAWTADEYCEKKKLLEAGLIGLACWLWFLVTFVSFVCYICFKSFARVVLVGLVWFGLVGLVC